MRKDLTLEDLGDLVELRLLAVLATHRRDGTVLLSPVWHEWRDGGFQVVTGSRDVKAARLVAFGDPDWYIELTPHTSAKGELDLAFEIDDASSPVEVGWSDSDDRRLGIRLRTITLLPADDEAAQGLGTVQPAKAPVHEGAQALRLLLRGGVHFVGARDGG